MNEGIWRALNESIESCMRLEADLRSIKGRYFYRRAADKAELMEERALAAQADVVVALRIELAEMAKEAAS